ncbi:MAG: TonB-dependent receptor [Pseudomonadota bacterium]
MQPVKNLEGGFEPYFPLNVDLTVPEEITTGTFIGSARNSLNNEYVYAVAQVVHDFLDNLKLTVRGSYLDTEGDQAYGNGFYRCSYYDDYNPDYQFNGIPFDDRTGNRYGFVRANEEEQVYLDVQLAGAFDLFGQKHDALLGFTYSDRESFNTNFLTEDLGIVVLTDPSTFIGPAITLELPEDADGFNNQDELTSVYAEVYLRPHERITVPFGFRWDEVEESRATSRFATPEVRTESDTTIKTGINASITDSVRVFYSYAESFVPQAQLSRTGFLNPERGRAHEVGVKYRGPRGLSFDASVFEITREDLAAFDPTNEPGDGFFVAAGGQQSTGFEVSASGNVTDTISISVNFGYNDVEITEEIFGNIGQVWLIPEYNGSAYIDYNSLSTGFRGSIGVRFTGDVPLRFPTVFVPHRDLGFVDGYAIADLMLGYQFNNSWDVQLNVFNALDNEYLRAFGFGFGAGGGFTFGQPLNAQLQVRWSY